MKKLKLLLTLLLVALGANVWAQTPITNLEQLSADKIYTIDTDASQTNRGCLLYAPDATDRVYATGEHADITKVNHWWAIIPVDGGYHLYNYGAHKYVTRGTIYDYGYKMLWTDTPDLVTIVSTNNNNANYPWAIKFGNYYTNVNNGKTRVVISDWGGATKWDEGNQWVITEVGDAPRVRLDFTDECGNVVSEDYNLRTVYDEETAKAAATAYLTKAGVSGAYTYDANAGDFITQSTVNGVIIYTVKVHNNVPFNVARRVESGFDTRSEVWYTINTRYKQNTNSSVSQSATNAKYLVRVDDNTITTVNETRQLNANYLWAFVKAENTHNVYDVYNMGQALDNNQIDNIISSATLGASSTNLATFTATKTCSQFRVVMKDDNYFLLQNPDNVNANLGRHGKNTTYDNAGSLLAFWTDAGSADDPGSHFNVTPVAELCDFDFDVSDTEHTAANGYVGAYTDPENALVSAYNQWRANPTYSNLHALIDAANAGDAPARLAINVNSYYQLVPYNNDALVLSANPYKNTSGENLASDDNRGLTLSASASTPMTLLRFHSDQEGSDNYDIEYVNSNFWFADLSAFTPTDSNTPQADLPRSQPGEGIAYFLNNERGKVNVWSLHCTTSLKNYLTAGADNSTVVVAAPAVSTNDNALWYIREVTSLTITIGDTDWATLCLPVAVVLPSVEGMEFYRCSGISNNELQLSEIAGGTRLAAKVPFIMRGASAYTFTVLPADAENLTTPSPNFLTGTTARRVGFQDAGFNNDTYVLANINDVVGFYRTETAGIPANKAYYTIARSGSANAPVLRVRWGEDIATGLEALSTNANRVLYDLNGRVVAFPTTGIYVDANGRKVLVK